MKEAAKALTKILDWDDEIETLGVLKRIAKHYHIQKDSLLENFLITDFMKNERVLGQIEFIQYMGQIGNALESKELKSEVILWLKELSKLE